MGYKLSDPAFKDRHAGWMTPCTKRCSQAEMLEVTKSMAIDVCYFRPAESPDMCLDLYPERYLPVPQRGHVSFSWPP